MREKNTFAVHFRAGRATLDLTIMKAAVAFWQRNARDILMVAVHGNTTRATSASVDIVAPLAVTSISSELPLCQLEENRQCVGRHGAFAECEVRHPRALLPRVARKLKPFPVGSYVLLPQTVHLTDDPLQAIDSFCDLILPAFFPELPWGSTG
jgi:hypothetical protein